MISLPHAGDMLSLLHGQVVVDFVRLCSRAAAHGDAERTVDVLDDLDVDVERHVDARDLGPHLLHRRVRLCELFSAVERSASEQWKNGTYSMMRL